MNFTVVNNKINNRANKTEIILTKKNINKYLLYPIKI